MNLLLGRSHVAYLDWPWQNSPQAGAISCAALTFCLCGFNLGAWTCLWEMYLRVNTPKVAKGTCWAHLTRQKPGRYCPCRASGNAQTACLAGSPWLPRMPRQQPVRNC